jgi:hypothetical protein
VRYIKDKGTWNFSSRTTHEILWKIMITEKNHKLLTSQLFVTDCTKKGLASMPQFCLSYFLLITFWVPIAHKYNSCVVLELKFHVPLSLI